MTDAPLFDPETGEIIEAGGDNASPPEVPVMSLDDARALLVREHGVAIGNDDPILMLLTLHQGFFHDYEALLARHDRVIQSFLTATGEACAASVEAVLSSLKDKTIKASLDQAFALVERQAASMDRLDRSMRRNRLVIGFLTALATVSSIVSVAIFLKLLR